MYHVVKNISQHYLGTLLGNFRVVVVQLEPHPLRVFLHLYGIPTPRIYLKWLVLKNNGGGTYDIPTPEAFESQT